MREFFFFPFWLEMCLPPNLSALDSNSPKISIEEELRNDSMVRRAFCCAFTAFSISLRKSRLFRATKMGDIMG